MPIIKKKKGRVSKDGIFLDCAHCGCDHLGFLGMEIPPSPFLWECPHCGKANRQTKKIRKR